MFQSEDLKIFDWKSDLKHQAAPLRPTPRDVLAVLCGPEEAFVGKRNTQILRGIRSLHWKCSNLRHCRVFYGFWLIEGKNNVNRNPRRYIAKGDLLTEKTGRSRSGLGFMISRPWKKKARLISRSFVRKLQRTQQKPESWTHAKKKALKIRYLDMFSLKLHRVPGFDVLTLESSLLGEAFQERAAKEKIMLEESKRQVVASNAESWVLDEMPGLGSAKGCEEETHARRGHIKCTLQMKIWSKISPSMKPI